LSWQAQHSSLAGDLTVTQTQHLNRTQGFYNIYALSSQFLALTV